MKKHIKVASSPGIIATFAIPTFAIINSTSSHHLTINKVKMTNNITDLNEMTNKVPN